MNNQVIDMFCQQIEMEFRQTIRPAILKKIDKKLGEFPDEPKLLFLKGKYYFLSDEINQASYWFYQSIQKGANTADPYAYYSWTLLKQQAPDKAEDYVKQALKLDGANPASLLSAGLLAFSKKDYSRALDYCEQGIRTGVFLFEFLHLKIQIFLETARPNGEIIPLIKQAQRLGESHELDYLYAKLLYMNMQYDDCQKFCRKFLLKYPNSSYAEKMRHIVSKINSQGNNSQQAKTKQDNKQQSEQSARETKNVEKVPLETLLEELDQFIGLNSVKKTIHEFINILQVNEFRKNRGLQAEAIHPPHMIFYGKPGTGKTTIARLMGKIFHSMGLLEQGHLIEVRREDLVGQYIGHTEENTKKIIEEALGGVLLIDEAYTLAENGPKTNDFGQKAIDVLLPALTNHYGKFVVIATGYQEEMDNFLAANPGLKDRFTKHIFFEDYTPEELMQIFEQLCDKGGFKLGEDARGFLMEVFIEEYRKRDKTFSNARFVNNLYKQIKIAQSSRLVSIPKNEWTDDVLTTFTKEDVENSIYAGDRKTFNVPINDQLLAEKLDQLHRLIGLESVKKEIDKLVKLVRYYKEEGEDPRKLVKHTLLLGNPGTGKTEVARILAGIYEALGVLERGDLVEVDRNGLVDKYRGGTEEKTLKQIERALGGTLFIDEAYTLTNKDRQDPGHTAIEIILKKMSDWEGRFMVIAAGYSTEMEQFLDSNSGLRRRFGLTLHFEDYKPAELIEIAKLYLGGNKLSPEAERTLLGHFETLYENRGRTFGNAGLARKIAEQSIQNRDYRLASLPEQERTAENKTTIQAEDLVLLTT